MASSAKAPTASASIVDGWDTPANVYSSDNSRVLATATTAIMAATHFDFAIPAGSTITGIQIDVEGYGSAGTAARRGLRASPTKDGSNKAGDTGAQTDLTQTEAGNYKTWGGDGTMWGTTWSVAEINADTFGVLLQPSGTTNYNRYVDYVLVTVFYTEASSGETNVSYMIL